MSPAGARLSIGALSSATGIPVETLRTWESRYGFPAPERQPSGHRVYPLTSIPRLRRIAEAIARGHRAGHVVPASEKDLEELLQVSAPAAPRPGGVALSPDGGEPGAAGLLRHVERFDSESFARALLADWARLGPLGFLRRRAVPLVAELGRAWEERRLDVRHEHFASERLEDLLRSMRFPIEERARGPLVVLATLPGEQHGLGLQMAALVFANAGCRILYLGTDCPLADLVEVVRDQRAAVLALSVSVASAGANTTRQARRLRGRLPRRTVLLLGGEGAPPASAGIEVIQDLQQLDDWARRLAGRER